MLKKPLSDPPSSKLPVTVQVTSALAVEGAVATAIAAAHPARASRPFAFPIFILPTRCGARERRRRECRRFWERHI